MTIDFSDVHASVTNAMRTHVAAVAARISLSREEGYGEAWGTGTYVLGKLGTALVSNKHVLVDDIPAFARLAHLPGPTDDYVEIRGATVSVPWPVDAASVTLAGLPDGCFQQAVPLNLFDERFAPLDGEFLFWMGFPGTTALRNEAVTEGRKRMTRYKPILELPGLGMLSQVDKGWDGKHDYFVPDKHVALFYPPIATDAITGEPTALPNAKGMSGSFLWDTKVVVSMRDGKPWSPADSRICGLVWGVLDHPEVVLATRIEHVRAALPSVL